MPTTTIKVDSATRDRLAHLARARGTTMSTLLSDFAERLETEQRQVWSVTLDPTVANEQRGTRPCVVVSIDRFNALPIRQAIVVPLTTWDRGFRTTSRAPTMVG